MKKRYNITLNEDTRDRLLQYGYAKKVPGGLSGVLEFIAWHSIKVKNEQVRGQSNINDFLHPTEAQIQELNKLLKK